jgi:hypothetical protein
MLEGKISTSKDKAGHSMKKLSIHQRDITVSDLYSPNYRDSKYTQENS